MCRKTRNIKVQKPHNSSLGKSGFTLVELSVVLALIAILTTMIASFSVLMNGFASESKTEYKFSEDHATLKDVFGIWIAENDAKGNVFAVGIDGTLTVAGRSVSFSDGVLSLGEKQRSGLDSIDGVSFTTNGKLLKCVTYRIGKNGERTENSFVFSLRAADLDASEVIVDD